jgi:hypothetical protein
MAVPTAAATSPARRAPPAGDLEEERAPDELDEEDAQPLLSDEEADPQYADSDALAEEEEEISIGESPDPTPPTRARRVLGRIPPRTAALKRDVLQIYIDPQGVQLRTESGTPRTRARREAHMQEETNGHTRRGAQGEGRRARSPSAVADTLLPPQSFAVASSLCSCVHLSRVGRA